MVRECRLPGAQGTARLCQHHGGPRACRQGAFAQGQKLRRAAPEAGGNAARSLLGRGPRNEGERRNAQAGGAYRSAHALSGGQRQACRGHQFIGRLWEHDRQAGSARRGSEELLPEGNDVAGRLSNRHPAHQRFASVARRRRSGSRVAGRAGRLDPSRTVRAVHAHVCEEPRRAPCVAIRRQRPRDPVFSACPIRTRRNASAVPSQDPRSNRLRCSGYSRLSAMSTCSKR